LIDWQEEGRGRGGGGLLEGWAGLHSVITRFKIFKTRSEVSEFKSFAAVNERKTLTALGFSSGAGCGGCEILLLFFHASHFVN
jgi:hypothetical protein